MKKKMLFLTFSLIFLFTILNGLSLSSNKAYGCHVDGMINVLLEHDALCEITAIDGYTAQFHGCSDDGNMCANNSQDYLMLADFITTTH